MLLQLVQVGSISAAASKSKMLRGEAAMVGVMVIMEWMAVEV
jgi:hypothetical protein